MRVRATVKGVYGHLREVDEVFEIASEKDFSSRWMAKVAGETPVTKPKKAPAKGPTPEQVEAEEAEAMERPVREVEADKADDADEAPKVARRTRRR